MKPPRPADPQRILVRATNWVGDAVMTLPACAALRAACPQARIAVLAKPWVAAVYQASPAVDEVLTFDAKGAHAGLAGLWRLSRELKARQYDWAVLWQNAIQAALIAWLAGVPVRLGYASDGRRLLLSHPVARTPQVRAMHETAYYLHILFEAGLLPEEPPAGGVRPVLELSPHDQGWAQGFLAGQDLPAGPLYGCAPGASFGPAKCWPAQRFAAALKGLASQAGATVLLFGSPAEAAATRAVAQGLEGLRVVDLAGRTGLAQALALLGRLDLFVTNDSGLMHAAAALGVPTVAVFGSTNPVTTAPLGPWVELVRHPIECSPCLKPVCPTGDLRCFDSITPQEVAQAARGLLQRAPAAGAGQGAGQP
ncbi:MAG: lipopolysaccharide heptosyltransferase II [Desulfarculus sp.]|nr:lipopolysaccharide heptosyltransferase II [Desulfarculus sp.]